MLELGKKIAQAVATGKVIIGTERSLKALKRGQAKLVIVASNCAPEALEDAQHYSRLSGVELRVYEGDNVSLGLACGKPFSVDMLVVLDPGSSNILGTEGRR
ncbi:MAG: 50S ribosomal protein L30e [Hadesarchaea archaeon]|nr:50S ribosomal protein L30e [Hadesarchaea archaeon]